MRDLAAATIVNALHELRRRAEMLGIDIRPVSDFASGDGELRAAVIGLHEGDGEIEYGATATGVPIAVFTPFGRKEESVVLVPRASVTAGQAEGAVRALSMSASDLLRLGDAERAMEEYSDYLGQSYENMATVHRLVGSMGRVSSSLDFVSGSLQNMVETLDCSWVGVSMVRDQELLGDLSGQSLCKTLRAETCDGLQRKLAGILDAWAIEGEQVIVPPEQNNGDAVIIQPIVHRSQQVGSLVMVGKNGETDDVSSSDTQLMEAIASCVSSVLETTTLYGEQAATFIGTLQAFSSSLDAKDRYTRGHSERVALLAGMLAEAAGHDQETVERYRLAGTLHDIGKIGVPDAVLCKAGRLTDEEFELIKRHPRIGYDILAPIPGARDLLPGVLYHHERWDGRGYPDRLVADAIPPIARALALADTFDAMSSNRAYRAALSRAEVLAEVEKCAGSQFDPELAALFVELNFEPFDRLLAKHGREQVNEQMQFGEGTRAA